MQDWENVLAHYNIKGRITGIKNGPLVQRIEFEPEAGTKLKNIAAALDDIARELGLSSLRAETIEGSSLIGFEVPQKEPQTIDFAALLNADAPQGRLPICLGCDVIGNPV